MNISVYLITDEYFLFYCSSHTSWSALQVFFRWIFHLGIFKMIWIESLMPLIFFCKTLSLFQLEQLTNLNIVRIKKLDLIGAALVTQMITHLKITDCSFMNDKEINLFTEKRKIIYFNYRKENKKKFSQRILSLHLYFICMQFDSMNRNQ